MPQHPTAIVDPGASLGADVEIGPFCVIGPHVSLGDGCRLHSHVTVQGHTSVGEGCEIFPFASLGHRPQDMKYKGEPTRLDVGRRNVIREGVTMHTGTAGGRMVTRVGDDCLFMAYSHIAHDCIVGNQVVMANAATLGGHCEIGSHVIIGGLSAVHQFVRIGDFAFVGGMSGVDADIIPFGMAVGVRSGLAGLNLVGLKRRGFSREQIRGLQQACLMLFGADGTLNERIEKVEKRFSGDENVARILAFVRADKSRPLAALNLPAQPVPAASPAGP